MIIHNTIAPMNPQNIPQTGEQTTEKKENFLKEIVRFTLVALIIVTLIKLYIIQPFIVLGQSMEPTFENAQYLIVDEISYRLDDPKREDVIIFKYPRDTSQYFIKRIIGLPGETVNMKDGKINIINEANPNGILLDDSYVYQEHKTHETSTIKLGPTEYFVMGDNRSQSSDSRSWGPLEKKYIIGRPLVRLFPFTKISVFPGKIDEKTR